MAFMSFLTKFTWIDWIGFVLFVASWFGYEQVVERGWFRTKRLREETNKLRLKWAYVMLKRDPRVSDAAMIANLLPSLSFYANTTIYVIAGLLALLGTMDRLIDVASDLPFARQVSREVWEVKLLLLLMVFIVAYFKFTWSLRQFNMLSLVVGAAPPPDEASEDDARRFARINALSGDEFNRGIRAYYFGLAAVFWFIQPWMFVAVTTLIIGVLYRRDFRSQTLAAMQK